MKILVNTTTVLMVILSAVSASAVGLGYKISTNIDARKSIGIERCEFNYVKEDTTIVFNQDIKEFDSSDRQILAAKENTEYKALGLEKQTETFDSWNTQTVTLVRYLGADNKEHLAHPSYLSIKSRLAIKFLSCESESEEPASFDVTSP